VALGDLRHTVSSNPEIVQLQSAVSDQFRALKQIGIVDGLRLTDVSLVTAQVNSINHGLGRQALGYLVTSTSAGALVWNDALTDKVIPLHVSANVTVDLWVF
jgi:hypothetical protein